jgi:CRP/FNR family cyclic AMP-dependent transcriptional regulator
MLRKSEVEQFEKGQIAAMPLFKDLTPQQMERVHQLLHHKTIETGSILIEKNQPGEEAYIVLSGSIKVCAKGADHSQVVVGVLGRGEVVGEMSLIDGLGRSATLIAQEQTSLLWINRQEFWEELWEMPPIAYNLTLLLSRRIRLLTAQVQVFTTANIKCRIAHQLLTYAREYGQKQQQDTSISIPFPLTQGDLANMIGASRAQVTQAISYWKRRKYISYSSDHHITLHDVKALERFC